MIDVTAGLVVSAFIAGLLTFLAPCTLPLVPAYLGFISGVATRELEDPATAARARKRLFLNGLFFVLGFTLLFVAFGALAGVAGQALVPFRLVLGKVAGSLVIFFGLTMLGVFRLSFLSKGSSLALPKFMKAGSVTSSFLVGSAFAFGWTPCVGPILATVLLVASQEATAFKGAFLLFVFSLGLAIPFLLISLAIHHASDRISGFFSWLKSYRVVVLGLFGLVLGSLLNVVLMAVASKLSAQALSIATAWYETASWILPIVTGLVLAYLAKRNETIDVLGVIGGSFLVALGLLLVTDSFGFLVQYGVNVYTSLGLGWFLEKL